MRTAQTALSLYPAVVDCIARIESQLASTAPVWRFEKDLAVLAIAKQYRGSRDCVHAIRHYVFAKAIGNRNALSSLASAVNVLSLNREGRDIARVSRMVFFHIVRLQETHPKCMSTPLEEVVLACLVHIASTETCPAALASPLLLRLSRYLNRSRRSLPKFRMSKPSRLVLRALGDNLSPPREPLRGE